MLIGSSTIDLVGAWRGTDAIIDVLRKDPDETVKVAAVRFLSATATDVRVATALGDMFFWADMDPFRRAQLRRAATEALQKSGAAALQSVLANFDQFVPARQLFLVTAIGDALVEPLQGIARDLHNGTRKRRRAIEALGYIKSSAAVLIGLLRDLVKDSESTLRDAIGAALSRITNQRFGDDSAAWLGWWEAQQR